MATKTKVEYVVTRSFDAFNEGERFTVERGDEWAKRMLDAGLLKEVPGGTGTDQARQG